MTTTAIVVNFNAGDHLAACVTDLLTGTEKPRVRVLDNASGDGSAERLVQRFGKRPDLEVMFNPTNAGFARAVNAAAAHLDSEYLMVVNPDCRVDRDTLALLRAALEEQPRAALAAPLVVDRRGRPEPAAVRRFPGPCNSLMSMTGLWRLERWLPGFAGVAVPPARLPQTTTAVEAVSGACLLIRRRAFEAVGGFDQGYGLHCEDLDLMYRLAQAGWACLIVPGARATHEQGVSSRSRPLWVHRQKHRGMRRFFDQHKAAECSAPLRWLVRLGIHLRCLLLWPWVYLRR